MSIAARQDCTFTGEGYEGESDTPSTADATTNAIEDIQICAMEDEVPIDKNSSQTNNCASRNQKYHIRGQGDDLVIAVCEIGEKQGQSRDETSLDPRVVTLSQHGGAAFEIPWTLCSQWSRIKEIIKLTYRSNEDAKKSIDEGSFTLSRNGSNFLPEHWNTIVRPWQCVEIRLDSQKMAEVDPFFMPDAVGPMMGFGTVTEPTQTKFGAQVTTAPVMMPVRYRVDFFLRTMYGNEDTFLRSKSWNTPTIIHSSGPDGDFSEVLEEIHHIVFGRKESYVQKKIDDFPDSVLTLGPDDTIKPKKLHIRSPLLLNALRSVVKYSSNPPLHDNVEPFVDGIWSFPFKELYHHRAELLDFQKQPGGARANHTAEENADCNRHIDILIDYLDHEPTVQLMLAKEQWVQKVPTTTFAGFWLLLKPGADVYVREYGQLNAYVVDLVFGGMNYESRSLRAENYRVHVWHLIFNGKTIKRRSKTIEIPVFDGERDIVSLPVFPTSFHDRLDGGRLRHELIKRGDNFFRYAKGPTFLEYSGIGMKQGAKKYNRARVVIEHQSLPWTLPEFSGTGAWFLSSSDTTEEVYRHDTSGFARPPPLPPMYHGGSYPGVGAIRGPGSRARVPRCECSQCKLVDSRTGTSISPTFSDYDSIDPRQAMGLSQHQALVCMSHMFGFILKDRAYDILDVNGLTEPIVAENAIDELVMRPEKNKETIKAIVKTYTDTNGQADLMGVDFIRGKGEGQIFLLHGPPGTGKTLTAESVAEYTKRPLLSITAADLGHDPVELERNLLRFFKNATAWDAIVLLDEADIYLERRSSKDLRRNSIVSIFLRALDYFEGIIFFTTNRVGHFDEAFMSRIHVAVGYDPLDDKAREQIWDTFFKKLKDNHRNGGPKIDYDYDAKQYVRKSEDVKNLQWNGREIRNAFQTALALAIADSKAARQKNRPEVDCVPLLTEAHLSQVVHMSAAFKTYIKATHEGMNESDLAFRLGNRYDEHENNNH